MDIVEALFYIAFISMFIGFLNSFFHIILLRRTRRDSSRSALPAQDNEEEDAEEMIERAERGDKAAIRWLEEHNYERV
jgi:hypothetical protein